VAGELPTDEARISGLVEGFISAFDGLARSQAGAQDPALLALQPQLFAKVTQSFVDFGNLVSSAIPEILDQSAQAPGAADDEAVDALVDAVADDADTHADTVGSLAGSLAEHIDTLDAPAPQLEQVLSAARAIEDYWREVADQLQAVPDLLDEGDTGQVAGLRALAPIWDRVADRVNEAQQTQEIPAAPAAGPSFKVIDGGKGAGPDA
jgi:ABC-type transporter Mla subunit MlaD